MVQKLLNDYTAEQLGYYLAGLIEGDGCFSKQDLSFVFHSKDVTIAKRLIQLLNVSSLTFPKKVIYVGFLISCKQGFKKVLMLTNGKWVGKSFETKHTSKTSVIQRLNLEFLPLTGKVSFDNAWLTGFFDADGCILITVCQDSTYAVQKLIDVTLSFSQKQPFLLDCIVR